MIFCAVLATITGVNHHVTCHENTPIEVIIIEGDYPMTHRYFS